MALCLVGLNPSFAGKTVAAVVLQQTHVRVK